jgi:carbonic anhydrase
MMTPTHAQRCDAALGAKAACLCGAEHAPPWTRRGFLKGAAAGAGAGLLAGLVLPGAALAEAPSHTGLDPDAAIAALMAGNRRFVRGAMASFKENLPKLREKTAPKQQPFAQLLSCADSRVPVELVFDQSIGRLFVTRVAGNVANADIMASIEYGVAQLHTPAIMVLGHSGCGAVEAAIAGKGVPGQISTLYRSLRPAVDEAGPDLEAVVKANAKIQAGLLRTSSPVLAERIKKGKLKIVAGYYELRSGVVTVLD